MWRGGDYALLISDCHMPEMDGYDLAREIRSAEEGAQSADTEDLVGTLVTIVGVGSY